MVSWGKSAGLLVQKEAGTRCFRTLVCFNFPHCPDCDGGSCKLCVGLGSSLKLNALFICKLNTN